MSQWTNNYSYVTCRLSRYRVIACRDGETSATKMVEFSGTRRRERTTLAGVSQWRLLVQCLVICCALSHHHGVCLESRSCVEITDIPICVPLGYSNTSFPNARGHRTQQEANDELLAFDPLISMNCSLHLRHFLCAYYVPFCKSEMPPDLEVPPCRELCLQVRADCEWIVKEYDGKWPQHLSCEHFPTIAAAPWCFGPGERVQPSTTHASSSEASSSMRVSSSSHELLHEMAKETAVFAIVTTTNENQLQNEVGLPTTTCITSTATAKDEMVVSKILTTSENQLQNEASLPTTITSTATAKDEMVVSKIPTTSEGQPQNEASHTQVIVTTAAGSIMATESPSTTTSFEQSSTAASDQLGSSIWAQATNTTQGQQLVVTHSGHEHAFSHLTTPDETPNTQGNTATPQSTPVISFTYLFDTSTSLGPNHLSSTLLPHPQENTSPTVSPLTSQQSNTVSIATQSASTLPHTHQAASNSPLATTASATSTTSLRLITPSISLQTLSPATTDENHPTIVHTQSYPLAKQTQLAFPTPHTISHSCTMLDNTSLCRQFGYSLISLPNSRGHTTQQQAEEELSKFTFFQRLDCSEQMDEFLCYYYLPPCNTSIIETTVPPCRELCELVRDQCINVLSQLQIQWPHHMDCTRLPSQHNHTCSTNDIQDIIGSPVPSVQLSSSEGLYRQSASLTTVIALLVTAVATTLLHIPT